MSRWPDPFAESIEGADPVAAGIRAYTGTITRPCASAGGWGKTSLQAQAGQMAARRITLADLGARVGETWTFGQAFSATGSGHLGQLSARRADGSGISSINLALYVGAGYHECSGQMVIPSGTVFFENRVVAGSGVVDLLGVSACMGTVTPDYAYSADPKTFAAGRVSAPFAGKRYVQFGDSIISQQNIPDVIAGRTGMSATNAGFGGCRMAQHQNLNYDKLSMYRLAAAIASHDFSAQDAAAATLNDTAIAAALARLKATDFATVEYIGIHYGTNDFTAAVPIGTPTDSDGTTFLGAVNLSISTLLTAFPQLKVIFSCPTWRLWRPSGTGDSDTNPNSAGLLLIQYVDALKARAEGLHCAILDLYRNCGVNAYNAASYLADDTHPNDAGARLWGGKMAAAIEAQF